MEIKLYDTAEQAVTASYSEAAFPSASLVRPGFSPDNPEWINANYETSFIMASDAFNRLVAKKDARKSPYSVIIDESKSIPNAVWAGGMGGTRRPVRIKMGLDPDPFRASWQKTKREWSPPTEQRFIASGDTIRYMKENISDYLNTL